MSFWRHNQGTKGDRVGGGGGEFSRVLDLFMHSVRRPANELLRPTIRNRPRERLSSSPFSCTHKEAFFGRSTRAFVCAKVSTACSHAGDGDVMLLIEEERERNEWYSS